MDEQWRQIGEFPSYAVSDLGNIMNLNSNRIKIISINQNGVRHVILMRGGKTFRRSLPILVADAFLMPPKHDHFNTLIHLDGNRANCRADNLMWRPRWFAIRYHRQFQPGAPRGFRVPIQDIRTGETFSNSWEAALKYGLLDREILVATMNRTYVFPTGQQFRTLVD